MTRKTLLPVAIAAFLSVVQAVQAQSLPQPVYITVDRRPAAGGFLYEFTAFGFGFGQGVSLTAPDGTLFQEGDTNRLVSIDNLALSEITGRFVGTWTINDAWNLPPGAVTQHHQFVVTNARLSGPYPATPSMLTPAEGAIVPPSFEATWASGSGLRLTGGPLDVDFVSSNRRQITVAFAAGEFQRSIGIRASAQNLTALGTATPLVDDPAHTFRVVVTLNSLSALRTVTAQNVPEPTAMSLVGLSFLVLSQSARTAANAGRRSVMLGSKLQSPKMRGPTARAGQPPSAAPPR